MKNSTTLAYLCLLAVLCSMFKNYETMIVCASFFATGYAICRAIEASATAREGTL